MKTLIPLLILLFSLCSFSQKQPPDLVIVASLLEGGEDIGIAFSKIIPKEKVESYINNLAQLGGRRIENLKIKDEEGTTSAHFLLTGGKLWGEDKPYIQLFINAFPDMDTLFVALFPLRKIENTLPLHFENENIIIRNLGVKSFNYEIKHKRKSEVPISLYSTWERWRFPLVSLTSLFVVAVTILILGRRKGRQ